MISATLKRSLALSSFAAALLIGPHPAVAQAADSTAQGTPSPLITQPINESQLTILKGNTHPLARPEVDLGTAPASLPMQRMLLALKRSPKQEAALRNLLDAQQTRSSASYHKWLTPEQFGKQFGPTNADMQTISAWLQSHGFQVGTTKGRTVLEFSGTAGQVQQAFHTTIHKYIVNGEEHWANANDPSIPTALTPAVAGVLTLHNFLKKPDVIFSKQRVDGRTRPGKQPDLTFSDGTHGIAPLDFATIYNSPAYNGGSSGENVTIGVIGRSNLYNGGQDVSDFRSSEIFNICCGAFNIILDGPDPGDLGGGEEVEATLDSTWSGAVAPGANIDLVVSATTNTTDGIDLSEVFIVENNLADIMTESFSGCEAFASSTDVTFHSQMAEQAAAQGITYFVSTGDNGAEGCDDPDSETVATGPISVNLLASTPFNIAVGGTTFNDTADPSKYWSGTNTNQESALSYIPEDVWNDSCTSATCGSNANIVAGSGGASTIFSRPPWQAGVNGSFDPSDMRDLPDVSLTASGSHDPYVLCLEGSCVPNEQGEFYIALVGGTSASAPSFAGIMALVGEQFAIASPTLGPRQGIANYTLYNLAASENSTFSQCNGSSTTTLPASTCIFNDVTVGNNAVPGEANYGSPTADYQAGVGYEMASGLGSVNITNLVDQWKTSFTSSTTTLSLAPTTGITHGQSVTANITVAPTSGTGAAPTGDVSLIAANPTPANPSGTTALAGFTLSASGSSGIVTSASITDLPGGTYDVYAYYQGNPTYSASTSTNVLVTVTPEASTTSLQVLTFSASGVQSTFTNGPFGSFVYLRANIAGASGHGTPTGTVNFTDTFGIIPGGTSSGLSLQLNSGDQFQNGANTATPNGILGFNTGTHTISAVYSGDASFDTSTSTTQSFTITPGFFASITSNAAVVVSAPGASGTVPFSVSSSTGFSGTISLACSQLPTGAACSFSPASVSANGTLTTTSGTITVITTASTAAALHSPDRHPFRHWLAMGSFALFSILLVGAPRRHRVPALLAVLLTLILLAPACGGGGSSTPTPPPPPPSTPTGSYNITVTATSGATTSTTGFTLIVQ